MPGVVKSLLPPVDFPEAGGVFILSPFLSQASTKGCYICFSGCRLKSQCQEALHKCQGQRAWEAVTSTHRWAQMQIVCAWCALVVMKSLNRQSWGVCCCCCCCWEKRKRCRNIREQKKWGEWKRERERREGNGGECVCVCVVASVAANCVVPSTVPCPTRERHSSL